jgi:dTMP kinase
MKLPLLVAVEGCSGSGKSSLIQALYDIFKSNNYPVIMTKQASPSNCEDSYQGQKLFDIILQDRRRHVLEVINPALKDGSLVLTDRYIQSSMVYQGGLDGLPPLYVLNANTAFPKPDLTILVRTSDVIITERLSKRATLTRFEQPEYRAKESTLYEQTTQALINRGWKFEYTDSSVLSSQEMALGLYTRLTA